MTAGAVSHPLEAFGADDAGVVHRGSDWGDRGQVPAGSGEKTARSGSAGREAPEEEEREIAAAAGGGAAGEDLKIEPPNRPAGNPAAEWNSVPSNYTGRTNGYGPFYIVLKLYSHLPP